MIAAILIALFFAAIVGFLIADIRDHRARRNAPRPEPRPVPQPNKVFATAIKARGRVLRDFDRVLS